MWDCLPVNSTWTLTLFAHVAEFLCSTWATNQCCTLIFTTSPQNLIFSCWFCVCDKALFWGRIFLWNWGERWKPQSTLCKSWCVHPPRHMSSYFLCSGWERLQDLQLQCALREAGHRYEISQEILMFYFEPMLLLATKSRIWINHCLSVGIHGEIIYSKHCCSVLRTYGADHSTLMKHSSTESWENPLSLSWPALKMRQGTSVSWHFSPSVLQAPDWITKIKEQIWQWIFCCHFSTTCCLSHNLLKRFRDGA